MLMYIKHNDTVLTQPITQLMDWDGSGHTQWTHGQQCCRYCDST